MSAVLITWSGKSSNIVSYTYFDNATLSVTYKGNRTYRYAGVPLGVVKELEEAESKGGFINSRIVSVYKYID